MLDSEKEKKEAAALEAEKVEEGKREFFADLEKCDDMNDKL